jgi:hypothetical protein
MANSIDSASRPTTSTLSDSPFQEWHVPVAQTQEERIAIMAARWEAGNDIWTNNKITDDELDGLPLRFLDDEYEGDDE